jgi:hypothetical protein
MVVCYSAIAWNQAAVIFGWPHAWLVSHGPAMVTADMICGVPRRLRVSHHHAGSCVAV